MKPSLVFLDIDGVLLTGSKRGCFAAVTAVRDQHINPAAVYSQRNSPTSTVIALEFAGRQHRI